MGQGCTCSPPDVADSQTAPVQSFFGAEGRTDGSGATKKEVWTPPNAALVRGAGARLHGRLAGGAATSALVTHGCAVRLRWTKAGERQIPIPPVTLPDVLAVPAKVVQVAAGEGHLLMLTVDPTPRVFSIGDNSFGQLGLGDSMERKDTGKAWEVQNLPPTALVAGVACGGHVSMAQSQRGDVWAWGRNEESGVLGQGPVPVACIPAPAPVVNIRRKIRAVQAATTGWTAFCISHLGAVFSWGGGLCGVHGHGHQEDEQYAKAIRGLEGVPVVQVAVGPLHAVALSGRGEVYTWGRIAGAFGTEMQLQLTPKVIDALLGIRCVQIAAGAEHSMTLADDGSVYAWGAHAGGVLGNLRLQDPSQMYAFVHKAELGVGRIRDIACGKYHSMFLEAGQGEGKERTGDIWLCGLGVAPSAHVASQDEGVPANRKMGVKALAAPMAAPLQLSKVDIRRVLEMMA